MKHNGEDYKFYSRCICGAITLNMNGKFCSFLESEKSKLFPGLDLKRIPHFETTSKCRYCANQKNQIKLNHKKGR